MAKGKGGMNKIVTETILEEGPSKKRLVVQLTEYEEHRLLDIRYWFYSKYQRELIRSKKGITLTKNYYLLIRNTLNRNNEKILDWLGVSYVPEHVQKYREEQEENIEKNIHKMGEIKKSSENEYYDKNFFQVEHKGGLDHIFYNESHPFHGELQSIGIDTDEKKLFLNLVNAILASYSKAKVKFENSPSTDPKILFQNLEYNWSEFLKNYLISGE